MVDSAYPALLALAYRMVWRAQDAEDIAHAAVVLYLERGTVPRLDWLIAEASRELYGTRTEGRDDRLTCYLADQYPLSGSLHDGGYDAHPALELASLYATPAKLVDRWEDELAEDQAMEWRLMGAADRDRRRAEADRALGSSSR